MILDLKGKRVVVTGGKYPVERAIAEAVIWLLKWDDDGNEAKVLPIAQLEIPSQRSFFSYLTMAPVNGKTQILLVRAVKRHRRLRPVIA